MKKSDKSAMMFLLALLVFSGCVAPLHYPEIDTVSPARIQYINSLEYSDSLMISQTYQHELARNFVLKLLAPWQTDTLRTSVQDAYWAVNYIRSRSGFGENMRPRTAGWINELIDNSAMESYGSIQWKGSNVRKVALRALPTQQPFFLDPARAGEGYPFDYLQNSSLHINSPLKIVNRSRDNAWLLVDSHWGMGWVPFDCVARLDSAQCSEWQGDEWAVTILDDSEISDSLGIWLAPSDLGAVLPLTGSDDGHLHVKLIQRNADGRAVIRAARMSTQQVARFPRKLSQRNCVQQFNELLNESYGWGGYHGNRDCSATVKDFYTPFGIWLPRNSASQNQCTFHQVSFDDEKLASISRLIDQNGVPFLSLLWKPGHIMIYAGSQYSQPLLFHNMWGLKTESRRFGEGRFIIGSAVVTSLHPGMDYNVPYISRTLGESLKMMTCVINPDSILIKNYNSGMQ